MNLGRKLTVVSMTIGAVLLVVPAFFIWQDMPLLGYEAEIHRAGEGQSSPYSPEAKERIERGSGLVVSNVTAGFASGHFTTLDMDLGVSIGYPPVDIDEATVILNSYRYYNLFPKQGEAAQVNVTVDKDENGSLGKRLLDGGDAVHLHIDHLAEFHPPLGLTFYAVSYSIQIFSPAVCTEPPLISDWTNMIRIRDEDGSYPRPTGQDLIISNETLIENEDRILVNRLVIVKNGSLTVRNSTLAFRSMSDKSRAGLLVGAGGQLLSENSTLNLTVSSYSDPDIDVEIYGNATIVRSLLRSGGRYMEGPKIFSDVQIESSAIKGPLHFYYCSPRIQNCSVDTGDPEENGLYFASSRATVSGCEMRGLWREEHFRGTPISASGRSNLTVTDCDFVNISSAIFARDGTHLLVQGNNFKDGHNGVVLDSSTGTVRENEFSNITGISAYLGSVIHVERNLFKSGKGMYLLFFVTAHAGGNEFVGFSEVAIESINARVHLSENRFTPGKTGALAVRQYHQLFFEIDREQDGRKGPVEIALTIEGGPGHGNHTTLEFEYPSRYAYVIFTEYTISSEGKRTDFSPYRITLSRKWWQFTFTPLINETAGYSILLKERWFDKYLAYAMIIIGAGLISGPPVVAAVLWYRKRRASRPGPGHKVRMALHADPAFDEETVEGDPRMIKIPASPGPKPPGQG